MRIEQSVWQGNFGYWQNGFIHANVLVIGYYAWKGYLEMGPGIVVCEVDAQVTDSRITSFDRVEFTAQFMGGQHLANHIHKYMPDESEINQLLQAVERYNPQKDIILLLITNNQTEVNLLQNLTIAPAECYTQVCNRWEEFMPSHLL